MTSLFLLLILTICIVMNYLRFFYKVETNKLILSLTTLGLIEINYLIAPEGFFSALMFPFIIITAISYYTLGGVVAALISGVLLFVQDPVSANQVYYLLVYLIFGTALGKYFGYYHKESLRNVQWQNQLYKQAKDLNILREISIALQSTLELDALLHIILTAITAGYGLGYNRAQLFLISEDGLHLEGKFGIGPMNSAEGYDIWENVVAAKMNLVDFIQLKERARVKDHELNDLVQSFRIPLTEQGGVLNRAIRQKRPFNEVEIDLDDPVQRTFAKTLGMQALAVIPLINRGNPVGVIVIDNIVNQREITNEELDSIIPLANQAAMAIENAHLYEQKEQMAITDGLTGLYNQRFFQGMLQKYCKSAREKESPVSVLVMDIDYFKNYNDTNGHLAGNGVLIQLTRIIKESIRESDIACRFGGEEFCILLPGATQEEAAEVGERLRYNVEQAEFYNQAAQPNGNLTVSIGVASYPELQVEEEGILNAADLALYQAKDQGKNLVRRFQGGDLDG